MSCCTAIAPRVTGRWALAVTLAATLAVKGEADLTDRRPLRLTVAGPAAPLPRGRRTELTCELQAVYDNPYDPSDIAMEAVFRGPGGAELRVPGFFLVDYRREPDGTVGPPVGSGWRVRVALPVAGPWQATITARDRTGAVTAPPVGLTCVDADGDGFLRLDPRDPSRLARESGRPYVPIGINLFSWTPLGHALPPERLTVCERYATRLADSGGNFLRLRADGWWNALEMTADAAAGYRGPGWYQPRTAWEIDRLFDLAEARRMGIMFCLENANSTVNGQATEGPDRWRRPYNYFLRENGGPCETVPGIWTDEAAWELVRRRLRYVVARWGASPSLLAWEFFNEVSCRPETIDAAVEWHRTMARTLRELDPWDHLVTTSAMGDESLTARLWDLPEMEIVQQHVYRRPDIAEHLATTTAGYRTRWTKPVFFGEYGIGPVEGKEGHYPFDPAGVHLHNGLWAPVAAGAAGAGAFWYIASEVDAPDRWGQYRLLTDWLAKAPWSAVDRPVEVRSTGWAVEPAVLHRTDFVVPTSPQYTFAAAPEDRFEITPDGGVTHAESLRPHLYAAPPRKRPPTLVVTSEQPTQLVIRVGDSVGDETNALRVDLDGRRVVEQPFPAGRGHGKAQREIPQYGNWASSYQEEVAVDLPAGRHEVRLEAVGKDRLEVTYTLRDYLVFERSRPLLVYGRAGDEAALLWCRNRLSTWSDLYAGRQPIPLAGYRIVLGGLRNGGYEVIWTDPWTGDELPPEQVRCEGGALPLELPRVVRDVACRVRRTEE